MLELKIWLIRLIPSTRVPKYKENYELNAKLEFSALVFGGEMLAHLHERQKIRGSSLCPGKNLYLGILIGRPLKLSSLKMTYPSKFYQNFKFNLRMNVCINLKKGHFKLIFLYIFT